MDLLSYTYKPESLILKGFLTLKRPKGAWPFVEYIAQIGKDGTVVVKALCYKPKPEGRGFETL
jgi:hypothetical protein